MKHYKAVMFDFDYTLGDATEAIFAGFTHAMAELGCPPPQREAVRRTVGMPLEDAFTLLTGNGDKETQVRFCTLFAQVARPIQRAGVPLCPGAKDLLLALRNQGVVTAVVSTKNTDTLVQILEGHDLDKVPALVVGGDLVQNAKPDPEGLNLAMERLGFSPKETLFCGDTTIDAETARRAGTDFCAVLNGTTPAEAFAAYPCNYVANDLISLHQWLDIS